MTQTTPPLNALKAFEAAARCGGYVAAGRELGVSPAAVSRQVRNLEDWLGRRLFTRLNNRVVLTDAGRVAADEAARALGRLARLGQRLGAGPARARLVLSVVPSLAERWVVPRLVEFLPRHPELGLDLRVEDDPVDFAGNEIDLRVCYGAQLYPEHAATELARDRVLPLCTPDFWENHGRAGPAGIADKRLIHTDWGPGFGSHPGWAEWFAAAGIPRRPDRDQGHRAGMSALALDFAAAGLGLALGQRLMAAGDLASGRLIAPADPALPLGQSYWAVHHPARAGRPGLAPLIDWLAEAASGAG